MRNIVYIFICFALFALIPTQGFATEKEFSHIRSAGDNTSGIPAVPYRAVMNQQNTQIYAKCMAQIIMSIEGEKVLLIPFPRDAEDIRMTLPKHEGKDQGTITSWIIEKALPFKPQGSLEKQRITFESMYDSLNGSLTALIAQEEVLFESLRHENPEVAQKNLEKINPNLALVGTRIAYTERKIEFAKQRLKFFEDGTPSSQLYVVRINSELPEGAEALVSYSYTLPNAYWRPMYVIDANSKDNTISVELMAKVTQNSDLDWLNVDLELTTAQGNERDPYPLNPWIVREFRGEAVYAMDSVQPRAMLSKGGVMANEAAPYFTQGTGMASWHVDKFPKLPEGTTVIKLSQENWKTPLLRIARPSITGNKVWLSAQYQIGSNFYPAGDASFLLDGVSTGKGMFEPTDNEAQLFFGADPLVSVQTKNVQRKKSEEGLIDKQQAWTWSLNYEISNKRDNSISVRVEEPQTQVEDSKMSVTYADAPSPQEGPEKTFIWNIDVAAKANATIKRSITVKAPEEMKLNLGR